MHIFISYAREDAEYAERLYEHLKTEGLQPWMDSRDILPGQSWKAAITSAIRRSGFFIALISSHSTSKRGYVQKELRVAIEVMQEMPPTDTFIIPVRLDDCESPFPELSELQRIDAFPSFDDAVHKLLLTLRPDRRQSHSESPAFPDAVVYATFLSDGCRLISFSQNGIWRVWNVATGALERTISINLASMFVSPQDDLLIGTRDDAITLFRISSAEEFGSFRTKHDVLSLAYLSTRRQIVVGCADGSLSLWDMAGERGRFVGGFVGKAYGRLEGVNKVAVSGDGRYAVSLSSAGNRVKAWDLATFEMTAELWGRDEISDFALSSDGRYIVWADIEDDVFYYSTIRMYDLLSKTEVAEWYEGHYINSVAVAPDGNTIAIASRRKGNSVVFWPADAHRGTSLYANESIAVLHGHTSEVSYVGFSPDGSRLVSGDCQGEIRVWDMVSGNCLTFAGR
jgi:WD40 repeat protein